MMTAFCLLYMSIAIIKVCTGTYVVSFQNSLIPGIPLDVRVLVQNASGNVNVSVGLIKTSNETIVVKNTTCVENGISASLTLNIPGSLPKARYEISTTGSGGLTFQNSSNIHFEDDGLLVFIQTDKSRYSAGQTVKYRAVLLLSNLRNFQGQATVTVKDGNNNRIDVVGPNHVEDGVVSGEIELSTQPVFGNWKVAINALGKTVSKSFEVNDYVLPRFSVEIIAPSTVNVSQSTFEVTVIARFTFRSDVLGNCTLLFYNEDQTWNHFELQSNLSGLVKFTVQMSDIKGKLVIDSKIIIRATVMDHATYLTMVTERQLNIDLNDQEYISIRNMYPYRQSFVPGLTYNTKLFVGRNKRPIGQRGYLSVTPTLTTALLKTCFIVTPIEKWLDVRSTTEETFTISFDESGYADLNYIVYSSDAQTISFSIVFNDRSVQSFDSKTTVHLYALHAHEMPVIRIKSNKAKAMVDEEVALTVSSTEALTGYLTFEIHSRGVWLKTETVAIQQATDTNHNMTVSKDMIPQAYITVSHLTEDGYFSADYIIIEADGDPLRNEVTVSFSATQLQPGESVIMHVTADSLSTVYLLVEDERNRIIGTGNDVFKADVLSEIETIGFTVKENIQRSQNSNSRKRSVRNNTRTLTKRSHGSLGDLDDTYIECGLVVMSDAKVMEKEKYTDLLIYQGYKQECKAPQIRQVSDGNQQPSFLLASNPSFKGNQQPSFLLASNPSFEGYQEPANHILANYPTSKAPFTTPPAKPTKPPGLTLSEVVRNKFPETWIWDKFSVGESGELSITKHVPDSITTWVTSVFAMNEKSGFGIADQKKKITVQKTFFLTMDLPPEIVLGEEFLLQITAFNYDHFPKQVFMQITLSEDPYQPIPAVAQVPTGQGKSTFVLINPKSVGTLSIQVMAKVGFFSITAPDIINKNVTVRPNGVYKLTNEQVLLDVSSNQDQFKKAFVLTDPPDMVAGTKLVKITVTGNFMIPSVNGLGQLIRLPSGCGEQTMLNFAPAIYITKYLTIVGKLTPEVETTSTKSLKKGLQNELRYQRNDGSFSAFGNRDSSGSSWLTAFVLKCFGQANGLIRIDDTVISKGMNWLLNCQRSSGDFSEPGRVIHYQMQAGTASGIKMTAFILISLLENRNTSGVQVSRLNTAIINGRQYLEARLHTASDLYTFAIVCYALVSADSSACSSCYTKLNNAAIFEDGTTHWEASRRVAKRNVDERPLAERAPAADIEATSYALLTYIKLEKYAEAFGVVKWLVSQRNPQGGWKSTQDTIISLQALTEYSSTVATSPTPDYGVQIHLLSFQNFSYDYSTTAATIDVMHNIEVPATVDFVLLQADGNGIAVCDITTSYYVSGNQLSDFIAVEVLILSETIHSITVKPCLRWSGPYQSGMLIIEVEMPTGFQPDNDYIEAQNIVKMHERRGRDVVMYFDGVNPNDIVCAQVKMNRADPVVKSQACHVTAYDYYEPSHQAITKYESGYLKSTNICDVCPLCEFCTGTAGGIQTGIGR